MTGIMINTVPRRVVLNPEATILEILHRIQSDQLEISRHEAVSLTELQSQGIPVSSMFNTILNFRNRGYSSIEDSLGQKKLLSKPRGGSKDRYVILFAPHSSNLIKYVDPESIIPL